jgi:nitronate monooxygenase
MAGERALDFPLQRQLTAHLARTGDAELQAMWAGQVAPLIRQMPAAELVATLVRETEAALAAAGSLK